MATKKTQQPRLTLHQLLIALSYWGSSVRLLLVAFIVAVILALRVAYLETNLATEINTVIYIVGSFALLDVGYVMLGRAYPLKRKLDVACLLIVELILALAYVLPNLANVHALGWFAKWSVLIVLFVLAIRALLGFLFSQPSKKRS